MFRSKIGVVLLISVLLGIQLYAEGASGFDFGLDLTLGTESVPQDPTDPLSPMVNFQKLSLEPDLEFGNFGIGLDLTVHFNISLSTTGSGIEFYLADWVPSVAGKSFLDLYLPKFSYVRYGHKGEPLYVKFGTFDDGTLGNGFIMGSYANDNFLPATRIFGAALDFDAALFNFPYVGFETFVGNVARIDVFGSRLFVRPLAMLSVPIVKNLQVGATVAGDFVPFLYDSDTTNDSFAESSVLIYGADFRLPVLTNPVISLAAFGDFVIQPQDRWGSMVGIGGQVLSILPYVLQVRMLGPDFIPDYFSSSYDLFRVEKFQAVNSAAAGDISFGWLASSGMTLFKDKIVFMLSADGSFTPAPAVGAGIADFPHLKSLLLIKEGIIGGFSFEAYYEKYYLGAPVAFGGSGDFWQDLLSPVNAVIGASVSYHMGGAVLSLVYNLSYDPATEDFIISSSLTSSISF